MYSTTSLQAHILHLLVGFSVLAGPCKTSSVTLFTEVLLGTLCDGVQKCSHGQHYWGCCCSVASCSDSVLSTNDHNKTLIQSHSSPSKLCNGESSLAKRKDGDTSKKLQAAFTPPETTCCSLNPVCIRHKGAFMYMLTAGPKFTLLLKMLRWEGHKQMGVSIDVSSPLSNTDKLELSSN